MRSNNRVSLLHAQFLKFGLVGIIGFIVDAAVLNLLMFLAGLGPYGARLFSYLVAATTTWTLNRHFTFRGFASKQASTEWVRFVVSNAIGGMINYGTYSALIASGEPFAGHPVLAVAAGSLNGLGFNFAVSRGMVFRP